MDNPRLIRLLSSTTVQIFGIALIVFIATLSADKTSGFRPLAYIAGLVLMSVIAIWIGQAITHHHHRNGVGKQREIGR